MAKKKIEKKVERKDAWAREAPTREVVIPTIGELRKAVKKHRPRGLEVHELGRRYTAKQDFFREVLAVEESITPRVDEALSQNDYGKVGAYLRTFYLEVCKRIDQAKYEIEDTSPRD